MVEVRSANLQKNVRFNLDSEVIISRHHTDLTTEERKLYWYSQEECNQMKRQVIAELTAIKEDSSLPLIRSMGGSPLQNRNGRRQQKDCPRFVVYDSKENNDIINSFSDCSLENKNSQCTILDMATLLGFDREIAAEVDEEQKTQDQNSDHFKDLCVTFFDEIQADFTASASEEDTLINPY